MLAYEAVAARISIVWEHPFIITGVSFTRSGFDHRYWTQLRTETYEPLAVPGPPA
jgi:hypothetical protein